MIKFALHTYIPNRYLKWATFEELETATCCYQSVHDANRGAAEAGAS